MTLLTATALLLAVLSSVNARDLFLFAGQSNMEGWSNWKEGADWKYLDRALFDDVAQIIDDSVLNGRSVDSLETKIRDRIYQAQLLKNKNQDEAKVVAETQTRDMMALYTRGLTENLKEPVPGALCTFWSNRYPLESPVPVSYDSMCGRMFGHELMFSKSLVSKGFSDFAVHKVAVGGKKIEEFMKPSKSVSGTYWSKIRSTIHKKIENGDTWAGIVWHQGSQNSWDDSYKEYGKNLDILMSDLRLEMCEADAGCSDRFQIPIIVVQNGFWPQNSNAEVIRGAQEVFAMNDPRAALVKTNDLGRFFHYDATSFLISGDRIANAIEPLLVGPPSESPSQVPSALPTTPMGEIPSTFPSLELSVTPTAQMSDVPSVVPSLSPSDISTKVANGDDSSLTPSLASSIVNSSVNGDDSSLTPSMTPSIVKSAVSTSPTITPTLSDDM